MAAAAKSFGKAGMAAYKTFAIAQATMDTYASAVAAYKSVVGIPYIGPVLAPIAAAAAIAAGLAQIAAIRSQGFMSGGYTGDGAPGEVAGAVHRGEWVMPADTVRAWGMANMAAIQQGQSPAGGSSTVNQTIAMFFDPYEMANRMRDAMNPIMLRATSGAQFRWRI